MLKSRLLGCIVAIAVAAPLDAGEVLAVGSAAPELQLSAILQPVPGADVGWSALRGKVVVLEFWATWCAPCVDSIPHLNELAEGLGDPVLFLSIGDEPADVIRGFVKKRPIRGWLAVDDDGKTQEAYGVSALPATVIVDAEGRVAAVTDPRVLKREQLLAVIERRALAGVAPAVLTGQSEGAVPDTLPAVYRARVLRVDAEEIERRQRRRSISHDVHSVEALSHSVVEAMAVAWDFWSPQRTVFDFIPPAELYDFTISAAAGPEYAWREDLKRIIADTFGIAGRKEVREVQVGGLGLRDGRAPACDPPSGGSRTRYRSGEIETWNTPLGSVAHALEQVLGLAVIDETGTDQPFDCKITWDRADEDSVVEALARLNLTFERRRQQMEYLVLTLDPSRIARVPD